MDIQFILIAVMACITSVIYSLYNYFTKTDAADFQIKRLIASIIFGFFIGIVAVYTVAQTGMQVQDVSWTYIGGLFIMYSGIQGYINRGVDYIFFKATGQKFMARRK